VKRFLISACRRYVAFGLLSGFLVLAFAGHAIAWSWIYLGNDAGGDHNSGKQSLDMVEFYYNLDDTYLSFKIVCAATPPNNSAGENYGITYEVRLDTKPGGYTYYNDQWNTDREWDYSIQLDYPAGGLIASLYKYDGAGDWMFVQNVPHEMGDPDAVILKVPLGEIEFVDDTIYVQFNTNDRSGDYWWFADISSVLTLDITPPTVPSLIWPENNQNILDNTPTFVWTPVSDPSGVTYQIQIDDNVDFSSPIYFAVDLVDNWHTLPDENSLTLFVQYFWRVRAVDGVGNIGDWSETWSFGVVPIGAIGAILMPLFMLLPLLLALRRQNRRYQFACHNRLLRYFCLILYNRTSIFIVK